MKKLVFLILTGFLTVFLLADTAFAICGDGIIDGQEECDDGDANDYNACRNNCTIYDPYFTDVPGTHWAFEYVQRLYEYAISQGYPDGTYRPGNNVSRAEMSVYVIRTIDLVGDVTSVNAGMGLTGGGSNGDITLNADTTYLQKRVSDTCAAGSTISAINEDGSVVCNFESGDISAVTAGTGLTGGGTSGDVTLDADTTYLQMRVSDTCAAGSTISAINQDGSVVCDFSSGDISAVIAGTGLTGGGTSGDLTLAVEVPLVLTGSSSSTIIQGFNGGTGYAVFGGHSTSGHYGRLGTSTAGVTGGYGLNNKGHLGQSLYGVHGIASGLGLGVYGENSTYGNFGYLGSSTFGSYGKHNTSGNYGVLGFSTAGVVGQSGDLTNLGYLGTSEYGVHGTASDTSYGVYGENSPSGNYGYLGGSSMGVYGRSSDGFGVSAYSDSSYGVFSVSNFNHAGYFVSGTAPALKVNGGGDASLSNGSGYLLLGHENSTNIVIDNNEIMARNNGLPSKLYLNRGSSNVVVDVLEILGGADIAEPFKFTDDQSIKPGMVVAIDPERSGYMRLANKAYDRTVAGIISGANGINPGMTLSQEGTVADGSFPVALTGRVYAWAEALSGSIQPGDLLTTSDIPGHAMKVTDHKKAPGTILGKAMSSLDKGKGLVLVLVTLQ